MYALLKFAHILAVILFLGNVITGLFWKAHADRTKDPRIIGHTMEGIIRSDRLFTMPGVLFIIASGVVAAIRVGLPLLGTPWILWSIVLFSLSGLAFGFAVAPLQKKIAAMTVGKNADDFDWKLYRSDSLRWEVWGVFATVTPLLAAALMVLKPHW